MTEFRIYSLAVCIFFWATLCAGQEKFQVGLIGFYNLENLYDTINQEFVDDEEFTPNGSRRYTGAVYWDKLKHLDQVLSELGTDHSPEGLAVIGVAEIENRTVLKDLCLREKIKNRGYKIVHYDSRDARGVDVGLLYNPKYFKVLKSDKLFVDLSDVGQGLTRDILWVQGVFLGTEIHIMIGHWPSRRGGEEASMTRRCRAAEVMRKKADSIYRMDPAARIVVMGDLNDDPVSKSVVECLRATGEKSKARDGVFYNPFVDYFNKGIGTLAYNDAWNLFDQILISPKFLDKTGSLYYQGAHIFNRKYMISMDGQYRGYPLRTYQGDIYQGGYSDHFPTYIVLLKPLNLK